MQRETVAAEYSVSDSYEPDRPPQMADGFTKGCVGVQPQGKERLDNLETKDRDNRQSFRSPRTTMVIRKKRGFRSLNGEGMRQSTN
jgi:hypothetical protein